MGSAPVDWQTIAKKTRDEIYSKIPKDWLLSESTLKPENKDVSTAAESSGILTSKELEYTSTLDATGILQNISSGTWLAKDVMIAYCKRAAIAHQTVNCLTEICFTEAIAEATRQDKVFAETGRVIGPLHGLPVSIKDHVDVAGKRSTLGYCSLAENRPEEDAVLVKALKAAGAIVFVKTTMPVTGMALETTSNLFGRTCCGFNRDLVSGGSSGGEGALVGMRGSPMGIGTDIGGSIRIPCAFNGIYGIRPTTRRLSYEGVTSNLKGQIAIAAAIGPMCQSIRDVELICKIATDAEPWHYDANIVEKGWSSRPKIAEKLTIGLLTFDGVVMPHPPILNALNRAAKLLEEAGHEVVEFEPYQSQRAWDIAYPLYYATGGKEMASRLAESSEPWLPSAGKLSANPEVRERNLSVKDLFNLHAARDAYKMEYLKHWNATAIKTLSGKAIDLLICPIAASASFPHDFLPWWGYASQFNMLDYPGIIVPVGFVDKQIDVKDESYTPIGPKDEENYNLYDPGLFHNAPVSLQLIGRPFQDEKLLACAAIVDKVVNGTRF